MGVTLSKGQKVDLTKAHPGLQNVVVGLGWNSNLGANYDLDASAFLLGQNGKVQSDLDFVFYNNPSGGNGSIMYSGDNRIGSSVQDAEQIRIQLMNVPAHIHRIAFTITIHDAQAKRQNFGQVSDSYVRIFNEQTNEELLRYNLGMDFTVETAIVAAEIYRHNGEWKFNAIGSGFQGGLAALCHNFGVTVDEPPTNPAMGAGNQANFQQPATPSWQNQVGSQGGAQPFSSGNSFQPSQGNYDPYRQSQNTGAAAYGEPIHLQPQSATTSQPAYGYPPQTVSPLPSSNHTYGGYGGDDIICPRCHSANVRTG
ncbi:TerD family protein, partial [Bacillus rubiinfantis]|uniref:TerD family protein n=1 Tax=Bacillus rubiinfantis TaxID=1499680 RepID=UPI0005A7CF2A